MEPLPYFLLLLKKNVLLCSIIASGSFAQLDLGQVEHRIHSDGAMDLLNFSLGEGETFSEVNVMIVESGTSLTFHTTNPDYFEHPERYFQSEGVTRDARPYLLNGMEVKTRKKNMGEFVILPAPVPPASVWVRSSSLYGCVIAVHFFNDSPRILTND
jgi:hypothetical protein